MGPPEFGWEVLVLEERLGTVAEVKGAEVRLLLRRGAAELLGRWVAWLGGGAVAEVRLLLG